LVWAGQALLATVSRNSALTVAQSCGLLIVDESDRWMAIRGRDILCGQFSPDGVVLIAEALEALPESYANIRLNDQRLSERVRWA
jgi:hypothetical protein